MPRTADSRGRDTPPGRQHRFAALIEAGRSGRVRLVTLREGEYPRLCRMEILEGVDNIGFWDARTDQNWGLPEHRNVGLELSFLENGRLTYFVDGKPYPIRAGDLTLTLPWQSHRAGDPCLRAGRMVWFILDVRARRPRDRWQWPPWVVISKPNLTALTALLRNNPRPVRRATPELAACFARIERLISEPDRNGTGVSRLAVLLNELFVALLEMLEAQTVKPVPTLATAEGTVARFLKTLEARLTEPWSLAMMTAQTGVQRTRLSYYCRRLTGRTPMEHLTHLRLAKARRLLRATAASVTDIALECGFQSSQYFSTVFRRIETISPREFRAFGVRH